MKNMSANRNGQAGFTLLEIIVVLAVLGALAAIMTPVVFRYIDDANVSRAQGDVTSIAAAINKMYKDTGRWPIKATGTSNAAWAGATDPSVLTSAAGCTSASTVTVCDTSAPGVGATTWSYASQGDSLARHLITNTAAYAVTGNKKWLGPYLDNITTTDPWGRSYLVNIRGAAPANDDMVIVISAGPDGILQTAWDSPPETAAAGLGDDIVARVK
jgi:prepilin-type N-terminal cleavage/methylation domain-containing protein